jgi:hypothetical protein
MTRKTEIEVEIDSEGNVTFHVKGIKGKGCLQVAEALEKVLGPIKEKKLTSEYYEVEVSKRGEIKGKVGK